MMTTSDEALKGIFLNGLKEGREMVAVWRAEPLSEGHVRLAADGTRPLDVRPCYRVGRMIVDLRTDGSTSVPKGQPLRYVVSDTVSGMRLCAFSVDSRGRSQGAAKRAAIVAASRAAEYINAAEQGDVAAIRVLKALKDGER